MRRSEFFPTGWLVLLIVVVLDHVVIIFPYLLPSVNPDRVHLGASIVSATPRWGAGSCTTPPAPSRVCARVVAHSGLCVFYREVEVGRKNQTINCDRLLIDCSIFPGHVIDSLSFFGMSCVPFR